MANLNKKKILIVSSGLSNEGIGVFLLNNFKHLDKNKFEIVFCFATKYKQKYEDYVVQNGAKVIRTCEIEGGISYILKHFFSLVHILRRGDYDVIHSNMDYLNGINMIASYIAGVKTRISHAHTVKKNDRIFIEKVYNILMRICNIIFSNHKIGCSEKATSDLNGGGEVINNGIDLSEFSNHNKIPDDIRLLDTKNVVTVGRIDEEKNPFFIIDILWELKQLQINFHFFWIGDGSLRTTVESRIASKGLTKCVTFLGSRNDVNLILPHMNCFVLPSLYEGFGISAIESQAAGVITLISDALPKKIDCGLTLRLPLHSASDWANEISLILEDEFTKVVDSRILQYDIRQTVRELEKIYSK